MIIKFKQPRPRRALSTEAIVMAVLALACLAQVAFSLAQGREMIQRLNEIATTTPAVKADAAHPATAISCLARSILENQK